MLSPAYTPTVNTQKTIINEYAKILFTALALLMKHNAELRGSRSGAYNLRSKCAG